VVLCRFKRHDLAEFVQSKPDLMRLLIAFVARELKLARDHLILLGIGSLMSAS
jgi:CRP-like cAMP-binding protein